MEKAKKVASAILEGLSLEEKKVMAKILIASNEEVEKELGHTKEQALKSFAKVSLDRHRQLLIKN